MNILYLKKSETIDLLTNRYCQFKNEGIYYCIKYSEIDNSIRIYTYDFNIKDWITLTAPLMVKLAKNDLWYENIVYNAINKYNRKIEKGTVA